MYWQIDALCFFVGLSIFLISIICNYPSMYWFLSLLWLWTYPVILEVLLNAIALLFDKGTSYIIKNQSRIVYHPDYNINLWGIEKGHAFDSQKYRKIAELLIAKQIIKY